MNKLAAVAVVVLVAVAVALMVGVGGKEKQSSVSDSAKKSLSYGVKKVKVDGVSATVKQPTAQEEKILMEQATASVVRTQFGTDLVRVLRTSASPKGYRVGPRGVVLTYVVTSLAEGTSPNVRLRITAELNFVMDVSYEKIRDEFSWDWQDVRVLKQQQEFF